MPIGLQLNDDILMWFWGVHCLLSVVGGKVFVGTFSTAYVTGQLTGVWCQMSVHVHVHVRVYGNCLFRKPQLMTCVIMRIVCSFFKNITCIFC